MNQSAAPPRSASGIAFRPAAEPRPAADALRLRNAELLAENARLTEAVAARDAFLIIAAHELRSPMTPIIGRIFMLRRQLRQDATAAEQIDQNLEQIEWLTTLFVKRATLLLDASRIASGKLRLDRVAVDICDVARTVARTFRPLGQDAGSQLRLELPEHGLTVMGDPLSVEEILDNLVSNAIKHAAGRPIVLRISEDAAVGVARISVADGGSGISPEDHARIFERFERAVPMGQHTSGFGVGLWIVKRLTEAMDGAFDVTSTPGAGSVFSVSLPTGPTGART